MKTGKNEVQSYSQMSEKSSSALAYDRLREDFFNNISHELRTPINVILGSLQLFEVMGDSLFLETNRGKFEKYEKIMKQNCYRLLRLVNNLIDVTKMDSGYISLTLSNINVVETMKSIVDRVRPFAEAKGLVLEFQCPQDKIVTALDEDKIGRVFLNLLSNAIKFTDEGGVIRVLVKEENGKVYISVKDSGIGIPESKLSVIFERFVPAEHSLARSHEGTGIGLSLSSAFVRLHGGRILVTSRVGKGSEFIIELPIRTEDESKLKELELGTELNLSPAEKVGIELSDL